MVLYRSSEHPPHSPPPPAAMFFFLFDASWRLDLILKEGHQRSISAKLYWNWSSRFWQNDFKVFYIAIKPYPLTAIFFSANHDSLNKLGRG